MRFYFDIRVMDGVAEDPEGVELPDLETAIREARIEANALIFDALRSGEALLARAIIVKDETGQVLDEVVVSVAGLFI